jgi:hypothetical protein
MNDVSVLDQDILTYEISDEVLEASAAAEPFAVFTLASCTGLMDCPA